MLALKDESVQKFGIVSVLNMVATKYRQNVDYEAHRLVYQTIGCLPVRIVAQYYAYDSNVWTHVVDVLTHLANPGIRVRTRSVTGPQQYVLFALAALGVPSNCIKTETRAIIEC